MTTVAEKVLRIVRRNPGLTEREVAEEIFSKRRGYQQRVNQHFRLLVAEKKLIRKGAGGIADPYTYRAR